MALKRHLGSLTAANWVSFDFDVSHSSCWGYSLINTFKLKKKKRIDQLNLCERNPRPPSIHPLPIARATGPMVLYPLHWCPILKNLSMQHISGYNSIQCAIECSVASPLGAPPGEWGAIDNGHIDHRGPNCSAALIWALVSSPTSSPPIHTHKTNGSQKEGSKEQLKKGVKKRRWQRLRMKRK